VDHYSKKVFRANILKTVWSFLSKHADKAYFNFSANYWSMITAFSTFSKRAWSSDKKKFWTYNDNTSLDNARMMINPFIYFLLFRRWICYVCFITNHICTTHETTYILIQKYNHFLHFIYKISIIWKIICYKYLVSYYQFLTFNKIILHTKKE